LVFFADNGSEMADFRIQGEVDSDILSRHLSAVLASGG